MKVLLCQVDGKLPNLALMTLSTWHRAAGHFVRKTDSPKEARNLQPDLVYCSSIFTTSQKKRDAFTELFPNAVTGGDGYRPVWKDLTLIRTKDQPLGIGSSLREVIKDHDPDAILPDYGLYPTFTGSIGYTQRGCRLDCSFCRMKTREGLPRGVRTIPGIYRGDPFPRTIHLLDNDFFGQPEWEARLNEAIEGKFKLSFNQGINIRLITHEQGKVLAKVKYTDDSFKKRRLYTAWDNLGDEKWFKDGVSMLADAGVPARHLMVYMLIGFRRGETEDEILHRYNELVKLKCMPYPMVYDPTRKDLKHFQRWVVGRYAQIVSWADYKKHWNVQIQKPEYHPFTVLPAAQDYLASL